MKAKAVNIWVNKEDKTVVVVEGRSRVFPYPWGDPIGCAYSQWNKMDNDTRVRLLTETALELAMDDFDLGAVLREFAKIDEFKAVGAKSFPMCRAITKAVLGTSLEPNTMSYEELFDAYQAA